MLQGAVDDAGPVEPGHYRKSPGDGGGLEPADLLHPPDVQLQVRAPRGERVQSVSRAPGKEAAQVRFGVLTGRALDPGQVGSHGRPQLVSERPETIGWEGSQVRGIHHELTLRPSQLDHEARSVPGATWPTFRCHRRAAADDRTPGLAVVLTSACDCGVGI
jgi:hypothetical protein